MTARRSKMGLARSRATLSIQDDLNSLTKTLQTLEENDAHLINIEKRKLKDSGSEIFLDIEFKCNRDVVDQLTKQFAKDEIEYQILKVEKRDLMRKTQSLDKGSTKYTSDGVPWFPRCIEDLDKSANRVLLYGIELDADHPGFKDPVYRERRKKLAQIALNYKSGQPIQRVEYTEEETQTWRTIYKELRKLYPIYACAEYLSNWPLLEKYCGYSEHQLPQLEDISNYLKRKTGFTLRPVAGYLSSRDFLAGLAFRVFHCTQYIRHSSDPFYTPEPDCCHELLGHMPLFLNQDFCEFSQELGLASLGVSEDEVQKLATCYFFTVEFGLTKENGELKIYGAGLLSSIAEIKHCMQDKTVIKRRFEPIETCTAECMITTFQNEYFYSESLNEVKDKLINYCRSIKRSFEVIYDPYTQKLEVLDTPSKIVDHILNLSNQLSRMNLALSKIKDLTFSEQTSFSSTDSLALITAAAAEAEAEEAGEHEQ